MDILREILSLSNQPNLTEKELGQRAKDWQDALEPVIPIDRLRDAYKAALSVHSGGFPVNAFEILDVYRQLRVNENSWAEAEWTKKYLDRTLHSMPRDPCPPSVDEALARALGKTK